MKNKLLQIINHYGLDKQLKYIHSEYFELDEAIISGDKPIHIAEEIADIQVMLKQFQYYYEIEDSEVEQIMAEKIDRQIKRIESEENDL